MKTIDNLWAAFAGESQARNKYTFFASIARKEGWQELAEFFEETAANEKEHAEIILKLLDKIGDSRQNLQTCIDGENYEWQQMYPDFAQVAELEGQAEALDFFRRVATVEKRHAARFQKLLDMLEKDELLNREPPIKWQCRECGYIYEGAEPPEICPLCGNSHEYFKPYYESY